MAHQYREAYIEKQVYAIECEYIYMNCSMLARDNKSFIPEMFLKEAEAEEDKQAERGEIYGKAGRRSNEVAKSRDTDEACAIEETPTTP